MLKIDATNQPVGRLASKLAIILRGKDKANFTPNIFPKEKVIVFNTDLLKLSGQKINQKVYYHHTGYPGGIKTEKLKELFKKDSREVLRRAVYGMLPKNRMRDQVIKNLLIYKQESSK